VELAFGFKSRWSDLFQQDVKVTIITDKKEVLPGENNDPARAEVDKKLREKGMQVITEQGTVKRVEPDGVVLSSGKKIYSNAIIWATGADP